MTIPARVREELGLKPGDEIEFFFKGDDLYLAKAGTAASTGLEPWKPEPKPAPRERSTEEPLAMVGLTTRRPASELTMRLMPNGQVTVPEAIRERLGLLPLTEVEFETEGSAARVAGATHPTGETRGQRLVRLAWGSATDRSMTTDEIMAMTRGEE